MKITVEVPDSHINWSLESPNSRYWASEMDWDPVSRTGFVVETHGPFEGARERHSLSGAKLNKALDAMATHHSRSFARLLYGSWDGDTGDLLLQLMAFGEVRYG